MIWRDIFLEEFEKKYFKSIQEFLKLEEAQNKLIYPAKKDIFKAFQLCPFNQVKVVIIGQDPYYGYNQANGLAFSVNSGIALPPSLRNIFLEIFADIGCVRTNGDLSDWAKQGVLLINTSLTVEANQANSHQTIGWHQFTRRIIEQINNQLQGIIFLLWGKHASQFKKEINNEIHYCLLSSHPSPFSYYLGFKGNKHFSQTNNILVNLGKKPIQWC
jgi:uracil-DNA glycosylase